MRRPIHSPTSPLVYLITDRRKLPGQGDLPSLVDFIRGAMAAGVDMVQVRERDLSARVLLHLIDTVAEAAAAHNVRVLVNDRADVAAACPGAGVHLTTRSMRPEVIRRSFPKLLIGVSTHNFEEVAAAERGGADFVVFGPVFETESKRQYGPPVGLEQLESVCARTRIPVLALGGISVNNFSEALRAGAAGVAGISLFTGAENLREVVSRIKGSGA